jgi:hypothetical protein
MNALSRRAGAAAVSSRPMKRVGWLGVLGLTMVAPLQAGTLSLGPDTSLDYLANLTYSAAWRLDKPDDTLNSNINGDDGNRNFAEGAMINNRLAVLGELHLRHQLYGVFLRGSAFYDDVYRRENDNDSPSTVNKSGDHRSFTDDAERYLGGRARLLDAYAYGTWYLGQTALDVRVGDQVVSWGESLFFPNMSGAQAPADATKSNVPGTEVKEILMPTGQVYLQWGLTSRISVASYWQWEWESTELNPVGAFFSGTDVIGPGATFLRVPSLAPLGMDEVPRGPDITPDDDGQWGVSTRLRLGDATEVGIHHIRYHDKNPVGVFTQVTSIEVAPGTFVSVPVEYNAAYIDDIKMTGLSFASELMGTAVAGEVTYREGAGININVGPSNSPTPGRADAVQANLGFTRLLLPTSLWDTLTLLGETSWLQLQDVEAISAGGVDYDTPSNERTAAAYQVLAQFGYLQVVPGWDLTLSLVHGHLFHGKPAIGGALGSFTGEGDERYSVGVTGKYLANLELQVAWNGYRGTPDLVNKTLADRSNIAFSAKYSF